MNATTLEGQGLLAPLRIRPLKALRAFNRLKQDKEDTRQVFEIIQALTGRSLERAYRRMLNTADGGRQAYLGQELSTFLDDPAWMAQFPAGSVGARFREFSAQRGLSVYGLAQEASAVDERVEAQHPIAWYARRVRDVHDIWHVLTGYGTDVVGEACILGFTYAQIRNLPLILLALGAANEFSRRHKGPPYARAVLEGYRRGRRAKPLVYEDYFALLAEPLDKARARLNIGESPIYSSIPYDARETYLVQALRAA